MQLVFEFGSRQIGPTVEVIRRVIGKRPYTIECLPREADTYERTADSIESAATKLEIGDIRAFSIRPQEENIRYALILSPFFEGAQRSLYLGTIEYTGKNYVPIWDLILATESLTVACLGYDEGVELEDTQLTVETFRWNQWPLVVGALRDPSDSTSWIIHEGPEIKWLANKM